MAWTIQVERRHLALWGRFARFWATYVAFCVIVGWHLGPTLEEVLMLTTLPLLVLVVSPPSKDRAGFYASLVSAAFAALMLGTHYLGWMADGVVNAPHWWFLLGAGIVIGGVCYLRDQADRRAREARRRAVH